MDKVTNIYTKFNVSDNTDSIAKITYHHMELTCALHDLFCGHGDIEIVNEKLLALQNIITKEYV